MPKDTFRAFIAIEIPKEIKASILTVIKPLRVHFASANIKWVDPINWHITLCFLGNISLQQFNCLDNELKQVISPFNDFDLEFTTIQPFPSVKKFHTISLRPEPISTLEKLATVITNSVTTCGIPTEKRSFKPHLTVARINDQTKINYQLLDGIKLPTINFKVTALKLFKSEPQPPRSVYTMMAAYELNKVT